MSNTHALVIHGGAGTLLKSAMTDELAAGYHAGLRAALEAGNAVLSAGGPAVEAVAVAVCALEDDTRFNAGRGAVFTSDGKQEMDAALMDGRDRRAGAVAGIFGPKNPIRAAQAVMDDGRHVFMIGEGANAFARRRGLAFENADYFFTQARWDALQETLSLRERGAVSDDPATVHGTVGAVALDAEGHLAAATSTGGITAKTPGRAGDSPVIGAGTIADDRSCAISATGQGEVFLRFAAAAEIETRMRLAGESLETAANAVVMDLLAPAGGSGGLVAIDRTGRIAMPFNCEGMYRGYVRADEAPVTAIYE